jgi:RNA recognition motif-containing protein
MVSTLIIVLTVILTGDFPFVAFVDFTNVPSAANARFFLDGSWMGNMKIIIRFGKQESSRVLRINIHDNVTAEDIEKLFAQYGQCELLELHRTGEKYALVEFKEEGAAKDALNDLQGKNINICISKTVSVQVLSSTEGS